MKKNILIVESDPTLYSLLRIHLQDPDYVIFQSTTIPDAIRTSTETKMDIVLVDLCDIRETDKPLLSGFKSGNPVSAPMKLLGVSKSVDPEFLQSSLSVFAQMDLFFLPPFSFELMVRIIRQTLAQQKPVSSYALPTV